MNINTLDSRLVEGGGSSTGYPPSNIDALNNITQAANLPLWKGLPWPGSSGGGDMYKSVYDPDGDGKFSFDVLPSPGTAAGTYAAGNDSRFHVHSNSSALGLIGASEGVPTWNGGAWPSSSGGGDMFKSVYDPDGDGRFAMAVLPAAGTGAGTYAAGDDARFLTTAQRSTLIKITESGGAPLWNGAAWPISIPGAVTSLSFFNAQQGTEVSTQLLKLTGGIISALNGVNGSDTKNAIIGVRDARGTSGVGVAGNVNQAVSAIAHTNSVQASSEWALSGVVHNYSTNNECGVIGVYGQANNSATGVTNGTYGGVWGGCFEAVDMTYGLEPNKGFIGAEMDVWISGHPPESVGALIVCGDSKVVRGVGTSADKRATRGIFVTANHGAKWDQGAQIRDYCMEGIWLYPNGTYSYTGTPPRQAIRIEGDHSDAYIKMGYGSAACGIDLTEFNTFSSGNAININYSHAYAVGGVAVIKRQAGGWPKILGNTSRNNYGGDINIDDAVNFVVDDLNRHSGIIKNVIKDLYSLINDLRFHGVIGGNPNNTNNPLFQTPPA